MTHEEEVRAFFAKRSGGKGKLKAKDWRAMGVQTDEMYSRQMDRQALVGVDGADYVAESLVAIDGTRNQMVRGKPLGPGNVPQFTHELAWRVRNELVSEHDRQRIWAENNPQTASAIDRLFAVLKDGPFRVGPKLTLLRTATGLSRNMLIDAGKALDVKKRKRGAGADAYSEWELPKSPV